MPLGKMLNKLKKICRYALYVVLTNAIYGFVLYSICTWLAGYSLLYAFLGNLALIVLGLVLDELIHKMYRSKKIVTEIKKEKNREKVYRSMQWLMDSFVSFKTVLYVFYILFLIVSQIIEFSPALNLADGDLNNFILVNKYSILLLVAFDTLSGQFTKDRKRMQTTSEKFKEHFKEEE
jgi:L-lactate permease